MSGPATAGSPLASAHCSRASCGCQLIGRLLRLDEVPRQRQVDRVERPLEQGGRFGGRRRRAEAAAERRFQARLPLAANVEHLLDVGVDETVGDLVGEFQRGLRLAVDFVRGRPGDGAAEGRGGLADFLLQIGGDLQAAHLPVGRLAAELIDLAAGQFDEKLVGVRPFHQGGRGAHEAAGAGDRPRGDEVAAFVHAAGGRHLRGSDAQVGRPGHVIRAAGHAGVFQFVGRFRPSSRREVLTASCP